MCWALGFVAARHGILTGMSPLGAGAASLRLAGLALIPVIAADGFGDLGGMGWRRGIVITLFGGLPLALWSYYGYVYVPLGHGASFSRRARRSAAWCWRALFSRKSCRRAALLAR
jgi:hypothetical protein